MFNPGREAQISAFQSPTVIPVQLCLSITASDLGIHANELVFGRWFARLLSPSLTPHLLLLLPANGNDSHLEQLTLSPYHLQQNVIA